MFIELFNSLLKLLTSVKWLKSQIYNYYVTANQFQWGEIGYCHVSEPCIYNPHTVLYSKEESFKLTQTHSCRVRCVILKEHYFCKDSKNIFPCGTSIISPGRVNLNTVLPVIETWKLEEYVTLQICWQWCFSTVYHLCIKINCTADQDWSSFVRWLEEGLVGRGTFQLSSARRYKL